jgi:hypothetical protein
MSRKISYAFRDDGVYAIENGQVIAFAETLDKIALNGQDVQALETVTEHAKAELGIRSQETSYDGDTEGLGGFGHGSSAKVATHIVTPNGLKGKIMGQVVPGLWSDEVTVRFENGHIARLEVTDDFTFTSDAKPLRAVASAKAQASSEDRIEFLREKLAEVADGDGLSLKTRLADLQEIQEIATELGSRRSASTEEVTELDTIRAEAAYEASEVRDALAYLEDAEPMAPPTPILSRVVEQEHVGRGDAGWLDKVAQDMIEEADATDFDKMLNEGPAVFVAELESGPLADQGLTASLATSFIESKVAAARPEIREKITELWVERVESARREAYANRKQTIAKEAAAEADLYESMPDDILFS